MLSLRSSGFDPERDSAGKSFFANRSLSESTGKKPRAWMNQARGRRRKMIPFAGQDAVASASSGVFTFVFT